MKITDVKTYIVAPNPGLPWLFVEVETDEGLTGLGESPDIWVTTCSRMASSR